MNTKTAWIAVAIVLLLAFAWYAFSAKQAAAPTETATTTESVMQETAQEPEEEPVADPEFVVLVTLTDSGFSPARVTVQAGDTVRFVNQSSRGMWVATDEHPTHTEYDGTSTREHCTDGRNTNGTFDQCQQASAGSFWEYTFEKRGTFGFHNHVGASNTGTVVVE